MHRSLKLPINCFLVRMNSIVKEQPNDRRLTPGWQEGLLKKCFQDVCNQLTVDISLAQLLQHRVWICCVSSRTIRANRNTLEYQTCKKRGGGDADSACIISNSNYFHLAAKGISLYNFFSSLRVLWFVDFTLRANC